MIGLAAVTTSLLYGVSKIQSSESCEEYARRLGNIANVPVKEYVQRDGSRSYEIKTKANECFIADTDKDGRVDLELMVSKPIAGRSAGFVIKNGEKTLF